MKGVWNYFILLMIYSTYCYATAIKRPLTTGCLTSSNENPEMINYQIASLPTTENLSSKHQAYVLDASGDNLSNNVELTNPEKTSAERKKIENSELLTSSNWVKTTNLKESLLPDNNVLDSQSSKSSLEMNSADNKFHDGNIVNLKDNQSTESIVETQSVSKSAPNDQKSSMFDKNLMESAFVSTSGKANLKNNSDLIKPYSKVAETDKSDIPTETSSNMESANTDDSAAKTSSRNIKHSNKKLESVSETNNKSLAHLVKTNRNSYTRPVFSLKRHTLKAQQEALKKLESMNSNADKESQPIQHHSTSTTTQNTPGLLPTVKKSELNSELKHEKIYQSINSGLNKPKESSVSSSVNQINVKKMENDKSSQESTFQNKMGNEKDFSFPKNTDSTQHEGSHPLGEITENTQNSNKESSLNEHIIQNHQQTFTPENTFSSQLSNSHPESVNVQNIDKDTLKNEDNRLPKDMSSENRAVPNHLANTGYLVSTPERQTHVNLQAPVLQGLNYKNQEYPPYHSKIHSPPPLVLYNLPNNQIYPIPGIDTPLYTINNDKRAIKTKSTQPEPLLKKLKDQNLQQNQFTNQYSMLSNNKELPYQQTTLGNQQLNPVNQYSLKSSRLNQQFQRSAHTSPQTKQEMSGRPLTGRQMSNMNDQTDQSLYVPLPIPESDSQNATSIVAAPPKQTNEPIPCTCGVFLSGQFKRGSSEPPKGNAVIETELTQTFPCSAAGRNQCTNKCLDVLVKHLPNSAAIVCGSLDYDIYKEKPYLWVKNCKNHWVNTNLSSGKEHCCKDGLPVKCSTL